LEAGSVRSPADGEEQIPISIEELDGSGIAEGIRAREGEGGSDYPGIGKVAVLVDLKSRVSERVSLTAGLPLPDAVLARPARNRACVGGHRAIGVEGHEGREKISQVLPGVTIDAVPEDLPHTYEGLVSCRPCGRLSLARDQGSCRGQSHEDDCYVLS